MTTDGHIETFVNSEGLRTDTNLGPSPAGTWNLSQASTAETWRGDTVRNYENDLSRWAALASQQDPIGTSGQATTNGQAGTGRTNPARTPPPGPREQIVGLRKWAGVIQVIEDDLLTVELAPLDHEGPTLLADFDLDLLAPDDTAAGVGDVVYLTTRIVRGRWGHKEVTSHLRLRRVGRWSREELREIHNQALDRARTFAQYEDDTT
jgi:hypothetical protein